METYRLTVGPQGNPPFPGFRWKNCRCANLIVSTKGFTPILRANRVPSLEHAVAIEALDRGGTNRCSSADRYITTSERTKKRCG
jgi:hypothetical protein